MGSRSINPSELGSPRGYSNGLLVDIDGKLLFIAGQIAWNKDQQIVSDDFVEQFDRALANVISVLTAAGGNSTNIARLGIYGQWMLFAFAMGFAIGFALDFLDLRRHAPRWAALFERVRAALLITAVVTGVLPLLAGPAAAAWLGMALVAVLLATNVAMLIGESPQAAYCATPEARPSQPASPTVRTPRQ